MINELASQIRSEEAEIERWLASCYQGAIPPIYTSVDIRNSGHKIAVVDTNLFPAGFNNLCETFSKQATDQFKAYFETHYPGTKKILLIPEDHTRNTYYFQNLNALFQMLQQAEFQVVIGSSRATLHAPERIPLSETESLTIHPIYLEGQRLRTQDFVPDLILLNNDLSEGFPNYLRNLEQPVIPAPELGWHVRRKSDHFQLVQGLIGELSKRLGMDPWLLTPLTTVEQGIDLDDSICLKRMADAANRLLMIIRQKYLEYKISEPPYLFIKNNSGTYGMAVTPVSSGDEILKWGRRLKNKMQSAKGGRTVSEYIIQEGIPTADFYRGKPFEPVVYLVGGSPIGIFFRIHEEKNAFESLNTRGMTFTCRCFHKLAPPSSAYNLTYEDKSDLFVITSLLGRIASLAVSQETNLAIPQNSSRNAPAPLCSGYTGR